MYHFLCTHVRYCYICIISLAHMSDIVTYVSFPLHTCQILLHMYHFPCTHVRYCYICIISLSHMSDIVTYVSFPLHKCQILQQVYYTVLLYHICLGQSYTIFSENMLHMYHYSCKICKFSSLGTLPYQYIKTKS